MIVELFIEGQRVELFDDETISITQGVQDVKDISKVFADFSQTFNVPASNVNNRIFKNYYNQDINNGFDARTRKDAIININTIPFKTGKIQLNGVKLEDGNPKQYQLTFFGDAIKVKDLIGDDKLNTLDWLDNFNHDYSFDNVLLGLTEGLDFTVDGVTYEKAVVYPLISYFRQYFYNSNTADTTSTDQLVNIAYNAVRNDGIRFDELKPAIKLSLIIEAITQKYGINFVGGFFESQEFQDIYVNLNKSTDKLSNGFLQYENVTTSRPNVTPALGIDRLDYGTIITPKAGFENIPYKVKLTIDGTTIFNSINFVTGTQSFNGTLSDVPDNINVTAEVITQQDFEFDATTRLNYVYLFGIITEVTQELFFNSYTDQVIDLSTSIINELQDIDTYEFLTSLFKTFNLIVAPSNGDILVEDLQSWYIEGDIIDITPFVDTRTKQVDKGVIFNNIDFKFQESEQVLADEFNQSNNRIYGNEQLTLYTDETQTKELDGETLEIESLFENPIFERLFDIDTNTQTSIQYCPYFDRQIESISDNPFIFYVNSVSVSTNPVGYRGTLPASYQEINTNILMPTHSQEIDFPSFNLNFAAEVNEYTSQIFPDTIYNKYYADYIGDVFSNKRRNYKYKAILPLRILNGLKLNDRVVIENTRYIINKITSNLTKREDSLELINDIYDSPLASDILNTSLFVPSLLRTSGQSSTLTAKYLGLANQKIKKLDTGFDTGWITINSFGNGVISTVNFTVDKNNSGAVRTMALEVLDGINNPKVIIVQSPKNITADTTLITSDTTLITADNG